MHRESHHLNLSVQGNFGSGISGGFFFRLLPDSFFFLTSLT